MSSMAEKFYASGAIASEPPSPFTSEFKVGDRVKFTNDAGIEFGPHKVLGYTKPEDVLYGRFIYIDYDCVWFPVKPEQLTRWPEGK